MAYRTGLGAQLGIAAETTWGTVATPARFLEFLNESMKLSIGRVEGAGLRSNKRVALSTQWAPGRKSVDGDVSFEVGNKGFGLVFKHMLGAVAITTPGGGTLSRLHTHTLGDPYGLGLTMQFGRPDTGGTVDPFAYLGCKVTNWELSNSVDQILQLKLGVSGSAEDTATSLAAASAPALTELLYWTGGSVTVGGSEVASLKSISINGDNALKTDRHYLTASGTTKKEPLANGLVGLGGTLQAEFESMTAYARFVAGTSAQIIATWTGSLIEGALYYYLKVTLPYCRFDGETPNVAGTDVTDLSLPFKVFNNGSDEPITLAYETTDTSS